MFKPHKKTDFHKKRTYSLAHYHQSTKTYNDSKLSTHVNNNSQHNHTLNTTTNHNDQQNRETVLGNYKQYLSTTSHHPVQNGKGLNQKFLAARKQSYLNTGYNNRKHRLEEITHQNKKIYTRINSQKSVYSREGMRKSYESNASISRRLSESKVSNRSNSSRSSTRSIKSNKNMKNKKIQQKKQIYKIDAKGVQNIRKQQVKKFKDIFSVQQAQNLKPPSHMSKRKRNQSVGIASSKTTISEKNHIISTNSVNTITNKLPPLGASNKTPHAYRVPLGLKNDGEFLHKIAEEMFRVPKPYK